MGTGAEMGMYRSAQHDDVCHASIVYTPISVACVRAPDRRQSEHGFGLQTPLFDTSGVDSPFF